MSVWEDGDYQKVAQQLKFATAELVQDLDCCPSWKVLDIGTGTGNAAIALGGYGCEVIGIDPSKNLLEIAKKRAKAEAVNVTFQSASAEDLPFEDEAFDAVISTFTLGHTQDENKTIQEMMRVLKPGGVLGFIQFSHTGVIVELEQKLNKFFGNDSSISPHYKFADKTFIKKTFEPYMKSFIFKKKQIFYRYTSAKHWCDFYFEFYGPLVKLLQSRSKKDQKKLKEMISEVLNRANVGKGECLVYPEDYLQVIAIKK
jgi:ubiquinone/menaquinone biosynthesis C-methylase UbiE